MSLENFLTGKKTLISCRGRLIDLSKPRIMGILNITPDSFYDGGRYTTEQAVLKRAEQIVAEGGDIIDIGACSTRPGAKQITEKEETARLLPALRSIVSEFSEIILSVDTYRAGVAEIAVKETGGCIINDISGGTMDENMCSAVAGLGVPYVLMHTKGRPENMQENPVYEDVVKEVIVHLGKRAEALKRSGVKDIIIDPGFGFGKTTDHNYKLLRNLHFFNAIGLPLMAGFSRKSMINKLLGISSENALNATTVLNTIALAAGVNILRVHDVKEATEAVKIMEVMKEV
ncbi:MAG: dihydropteroate synthase [Bacteroidetes bacterium]|nr:dihydropteroate synthase [Bacteroidota bacterium]